ncbi:MAG: hypothetical protein IKR92_04990 [Alphaproteobacteria bacterium]|nr:hypothetical protein [Alphaproteobacteria bacterium]
MTILPSLIERGEVKGASDKKSANTLTATVGKVPTHKASFAVTEANKFSFVTEQLSAESFANTHTEHTAPEEIFHIAGAHSE